MDDKKRYCIIGIIVSTLLITFLMETSGRPGTASVYFGLVSSFIFP